MHGSEELAIRLEAAVEAVVPAALEQVRTEAEALCPVDAVDLKASLQVRMEGEGTSGQVVADVPYAAYVELGTFRSAPQPFLYPAFALVRPKVPAMLKQLLTGG